MSNVEERVVKMRFDNAEFRRGAADSQKSLADLNKAVDSAGKTKGLLDLAGQMDTVKVRASAMSVAVGAAIATMASKVTTVATGMVSSLTFDPVRSGFAEYESMLTKQNVIMNATGQSADRVKGILNELNKYSDETIYSFGNMTDAITKFVNAGVPLDRAVVSIKGIANAAAFAGASSEEANRAMYAFSQSMSLGFIGLQDWMQIENANMGTVRFKNELLQAAAAVGTLKKQGDGYVTSNGTFVSATKGWRDGLQQQWATTEVLNKALGKYADTNTKLGRQAQEAATEVRTFSAFMDTLKESLGSGWAQIFTSMIGGLDESTKMWTGLADKVGHVVEGFFTFWQTSLQTWRSMGGFKKTIEAVGNALSPIGAILTVVARAWNAAFPTKNGGAGKTLYALSFALEALTTPLRWLADLILLLTKPLTVVFRIFHIGVAAVKAAATAIGDFVKKIAGMVDIDLSGAGGGFLQFFKDVGREISEAVKKIDDLIRKGKSLTEAFGSVDIKLPKLPGLPSMPSMGGLFGGGEKKDSGSKINTLVAGVKDLTGASEKLDKVQDRVSRGMYFNPDAVADSSMVVDRTKDVVNYGDEVRNTGQTVETVGDKMGGILSTLKEKLLGFIQGFSFEDLVASFNLAVLSAFVISITRFINTLTKSFRGFVGIGEGITDVLSGAGDALKSFQTAARAKLILNVAIALGILAASLFVLSRIPVDKMNVALYGLGGVVAALTVTMLVMTKMIEKLDGKGVSVKLVALGISVGFLAAAILGLAIAFKIMENTDLQGIAKGLITVAVVMKLMAGLGELSKGAGRQMLAASVAIAAISASMIVLAGALLLMKLVDWEDIGKAGAALLGLSLAVGLLSMIPYEGIAKVGLAMLTASLGVESLARALVLFGFVKWESLAKAGLALLGLTVALAALMVVGNPITVSGMVAMAAGMVGLALAGLILNKVNWSSLLKMAAVFTIITVAFAAFMAIVSFFAPAIILLSAFAGSIALLAVALTGLALAFAIIGPLLGAGTAMFAAFATGAAVAIGVFLQTLAAEAPIIKDALLKMLKELIDGIVEAVPMIIDGIQRLWAAVMKAFNDDSKKTLIGDSGKSWIEKLREGIAKKIPEIVEAAKNLLIRFIKGIAEKADEIAQWGVKLVVNLIKGVTNKVGDLVKAAADLIIAFAKGIGDQLDRIIKAGIELIADFLHRLADNIRSGAGKIGSGIKDVVSAFKDVGVQMVVGLIEGIKDKFGDALDVVGNLAGQLKDKAKGVLKIFSPSRVFYDIGQFLVQGLTNGIQNNAAAAITAVGSMMTGQIAIADSYMSKYIQQLEQRAIAARAKADGLKDAAEKAAKAAEKTKTKADDRAAQQLAQAAANADKVATAAEAKVAQEKQKQDRKEQWEAASSIERAQIRAQDAKDQIQRAKEAEARAAKNLNAAKALEKQAKTPGLSAAERKRLEKEAARLRELARRDAIFANKQLEMAKKSAEDALVWQSRAGAEAAAAYEKQFAAEAKADADAEAFEKLSAAEKAKIRQEEAEAMQKLAEENLKKAKELAFTDLEAANQLAELALNQAENARNLLDEANRLRSQGMQGSGAAGMGTVIDLAPTEAAALAFNDYADIYAAATAAAAATPTVEFNQYNNSPEALNEIEVYRQTNNLLTIAADALQPVA